MLGAHRAIGRQAGKSLRAVRPAGPIRCNSRFVAAIDQGTSSSRVVIYDANTLTQAAAHQVDLSASYSTPQPGWAQMDPKAILASVEESAAGALAKLGATAADLAGVGITNQRETIVIWDKNTGEPLHDAVLWLDTRTRETVSALEAELGGKDAIRPLCGLPISTYFSGIKLRWLMDNIPAVRAGIERGTAMVGTVDSWLVWNLTGRAVHVTDVTNASRTMLMDLASGTWSQQCIEQLGLQAASDALPAICSSAEEIGEVAPGSVLAGSRITGAIGDQQSAMLGQGCLSHGMAKTTYGTGAFTLLNTGTTPVPSKHGLLTTALYKLGKDAETWYALEGSVGSCGVGLNWFANKLGMVDSAVDLSQQAVLATDGTAGLYFVPAFGGILAPRWRDDACGTLVGMTLAHDKSHIARAALEGIGFQVAEVIQSMVADSGTALAEMRVDGGVSMSDPLLQYQANFLGVQVSRPRNVETTALGAARAAAVGAGIVDSFAASDLGGESVQFKPVIGDTERAMRFKEWNRAVEAALLFGSASASSSTSTST